MSGHHPCSMRWSPPVPQGGAVKKTILFPYNYILQFYEGTNSTAESSKNVEMIENLRRRLRRCRSMCSLSWMRTWRSVGWSLMNGCFSSCSVLGLIV